MLKTKLNGSSLVFGIMGIPWSFRSWSSLVFVIMFFDEHSPFLAVSFVSHTP